MTKTPKQKAISSETDFNRIEIHRQAMALLPEKKDKDPGIAILVADKKDHHRYQRFCSCKTSKKRTCPHILTLNQHYKAFLNAYGTNEFEDDFKESSWYHLAVVMAEGSSVQPQSVRMQPENRNGSDIITAYNTSAQAPLLSYLSQGTDCLTFKQRCGSFPENNGSIHRGIILNRLKLLTTTDNERMMANQGFKTRRQALEENFWYKVAYHCFREFGADSLVFEPDIDPASGMMSLRCKDKNRKDLLSIPIPRSKAYGLLTGFAENNNCRSPLIHSTLLEPVSKVQLTPDYDLEFQPLFKLSQENGDTLFFETDLLKPFRYGNLIYLKEQDIFAKVPPSGKSKTGFKQHKLKVVKKSRVPGFLDAFKDDLKDGPYIVDDKLDQLKIFKQFDWGKILLEAIERDWCYLSMEYSFGKTTISLSEILRSRKTGEQYIKTPEGWIDCRSTGLDELDTISAIGDSDKRDIKGKKMKLTRMELLRLWTAHEKTPEIAGDKNSAQQLKNLFDLKPSAPMPALKGMTSKLRNYQQIGTDWIRFLFENQFGGLLCDDMGLGKTHQVMAFMLHLKEQKKAESPFLVICPTTVLDHWHDKITVHTPGLKAIIYHGGQRHLEQALEENDVILTTYGVLRQDIKVLCQIPFCLAVLDEIQHIKNSKTKAHGAAIKIDAQMKLGLTGTPIENRLTELKALMDLTIPGYLGKDSYFVSRYVKEVEKGFESKKRKELSRLIYPFTLRRLKETVLKELPEKIEDIRLCRLSEDQTKLYNDAVENRGPELLTLLGQNDTSVPYIHVFALLTLLKQICNHPILLKEDVADYRKYQSGKWDLFKEIITQSLETGRKVVVFSQFLGMIQIIERYLNTKKVKFVSLTGSSRNRGKLVSTFNNDPACRVFVGSLKAGGTGIDLVAASVVIHYDRWWNAAREDQATDRVHRIGQKRGVQVFKLVTKGTLEEKISAIIEKKRILMDSIVKEDDPGLLKTFSRDDLMEMLSPHR